MQNIKKNDRFRYCFLLAPESFRFTNEKFLLQTKIPKKAF